jgi:membrane protease YdiL (CAAX protease family)
VRGLRAPSEDRLVGDRRWGAWFAVGWLLSQVVGGVFYAWALDAFAATGSGLAVGAAGVLADADPSLADGASLLALALWATPAWAVQLGAVGFATKARGQRLGRDLRLRAVPSDLAVGIGAGVVAQLAIGFVYWLSRVDVDDPARDLTGKGTGLGGAVVLLLLLAVVAPVVEELLYRGLLLGWLVTWMPQWAALLVSSVVFAAAHLQLVQFPGLVIAGLTFGALAVRSGRLGPAIAAHMAFNATTVLYLTTR